MQRRAMIWALAECLGITIERPEVPTPAPTAAAPMLRMLEDSLAELAPAAGHERYKQHAVAQLARCLTRYDAVGPELDRQDTEEIGALLGRTFADRADADRALEAFVRTAGPESDAALVQCFARQVERMVFALEPVADLVDGFDLAPAHL
jgi:hypothetical protein